MIYHKLPPRLFSYSLSKEVVLQVLEGIQIGVGKRQGSCRKAIEDKGSSLSPRTHRPKQGMAGLICNASLGETETCRYLGSTRQQGQPIGELHVHEKPCHKGTRQSDKDTQCLPPSYSATTRTEIRIKSGYKIFGQEDMLLLFHEISKMM